MFHVHGNLESRDGSYPEADLPEESKPGHENLLHGREQQPGRCPLSHRGQVQRHL